MMRILLLVSAAAALILGVWLAFAATGQVTLAWDPNDPAPDGYRIYQRIEGQPYDYSRPAWTGPETTTVITGLLPGITYYYVARAYVGADESGNSNEVSYTEPGPLPGRPLNVRLSKENDIMYLITDPVDGTRFDYYEVELDGEITRADAQRDDQGQARLHYDLTGITMGSHSARVREVSAWGVGAWTDPFDFDAALPGQPSGVGLSVD